MPSQSVEPIRLLIQSRLTVVAVLFSVLLATASSAEGAADATLGGDPTDGSGSHVTKVVALGASRNDFAGWVGHTIVVGDDAIEVTHLGRFVLPGNHRPHEVRMVDEQFAAVPGLSVVVPTTDAPVLQFAFAPLAAPVLLEAGGVYHLVSAETVNGDTFADLTGTVIETAEVARCDGPVYASPDAGWFTVPHDQTYGPANFRYTVASPPAKQVAVTNPGRGVVPGNPSVLPIDVEASPDIIAVEFYADAVRLGVDSTMPFSLSWTDPALGSHRLWAVGMDESGFAVTSSVVNVTVVSNAASQSFIVDRTLGNVRNNFGGWIGYQFTTGADPLSVDQLGRMVVAGNTQSHVVKLVTALRPEEDIAGASVVIETAGAVAGEFKYESLPAPVTLEARTAYYLVSSERLAEDAWHDIPGTVLTTSPVAVIDGGVYVGSAHFHWASEIGWTRGGGPNTGYGVPDFKYTVVPAVGEGDAAGPGPSSDLLTTLGCRLGPAGMTVTITGPAGSRVVLEASEDLVEWREVALRTLEGGQVTVVDAEGVFPRRFYRVWVTR